MQEPFGNCLYRDFDLWIQNAEIAQLVEQLICNQ